MYLSFYYLSKNVFLLPHSAIKKNYGFISEKYLFCIYCEFLHIPYGLRPHHIFLYQSKDNFKWNQFYLKLLCVTNLLLNNKSPFLYQVNYLLRFLFDIGLSNKFESYLFHNVSYFLNLGTFPIEITDNNLNNLSWLNMFCLDESFDVYL